MNAQPIKHIDVSVPYKEETVHVPAIISLLILCLVAAPLIMWILKVNKEGSRLSNVSEHHTLISRVETDIQTVGALLRNDAEELAALRKAQQTSVVTLIVPEVVIIDQRASSDKKASPLRVQLDGIYWSAKNPLVSIGDETYRVGDVIQGYEIVRIGKTSVQFQSPDGTIIVKDMYENLLK